MSLASLEEFPNLKYTILVPDEVSVKGPPLKSV
jgi:hypothetical protein